MPSLIKTLDDEYKGVRAHAGRTLALIGEPAREAVPRLTEALEDESQHVREVAAEALRRIDTVEAREALERNGWPK